jgi:hypothetical protein
MTPPSLRQKPVDALHYEMAQEMAGALGRMGRELERTLRALSDFESTCATQGPADLAAPGDVANKRRELTAKAGHALWQLIVQREACGLRDSRQVMRDYAVPAEVRNRMGIFP